MCLPLKGSVSRTGIRSLSPRDTESPVLAERRGRQGANKVKGNHGRLRMTKKRITVPATVPQSQRFPARRGRMASSATHATIGKKRRL